MHLNTDSVAGGMNEVLPITSLFNNVPACCVYSHNISPWHGRFYASQLGFQHDIVNLSGLLVCELHPGNNRAVQI